MALGNIAKQIAQQAIGNQVKEVLGTHETPAPEKTPVPGSPAENISGVMLAQLQAMQKAIKENEELVVFVRHGNETLRVLEVFVPSPQVLVLGGIDSQNNVTRVICGAASVQLTCKVLKIEPNAKATALRFLVPKKSD